MKSREQSIIHIVNEVIRNLGYAQERNYDNNLLPSHYFDILEDITNIICTRTRVYPDLLSSVIYFTDNLDIEYMNDSDYHCYQKLIKKLKINAELLKISPPILRDRSQAENIKKISE